MSLNFSKNSEHLVLLLDIGNGSVGAALSVASNGKKPKIIFSLRELLVFDEKPDILKLEQVLLEKLDITVKTIMSKGFNDIYFKTHSKKINKIFVVLSSPWYDSKGKTILLSQEKKFVITEEFLNDILSKELKFFEEEKKGNEVEGLPKTYLIENTFMKMKVNGYSLENPIGQKTGNFEICIYMSEAEKGFISKISNIISKHTHISDKDIIFHTFPMVAFYDLIDIFPDAYEYLYFDIAGEITDIVMVRSGMVKKSVSFPSGKNLVTRRIAKNLNVPSEVARSFFRLFVDKRANKEVEENIYKAIYEAENEWNVYLDDAITSISEGAPKITASISDFTSGAVESLEPETSLPKRIFITTYPQNFEMFRDFLKMEKTDNTAKWRKGLSFTYLGVDVLNGLVEYNQTVQFDAFLALEALFVSKYI